MFGEYYIYYFYYTFLGYPFIIRVAVLAITLFLPFFVYMLFRLLKARYEYRKKEVLENHIRNTYLEKIKFIISSDKNFLYEDIAAELDYNTKKLSGKKKRILTNYILELRDQVEHFNQANFQEVITYFNLTQYWISKLKFGSIASRQKALRKLDDFNTEIPGAVIASLTNNRNKFLRKKARSYYMNLSKNSPYKYFDENFDQTFNEWDKIEIHRILSKRSVNDLPNLVQWIKNSENSEFKIFLVDEIKYFRQNESCYYLLEILDTRDIKLRKHCIETLGELKCQLAEKRLIDSYQQQPLIIQRSIIEAIAKLNSGNAVSFLEEAYFSAHDDESKLIIVRAIYNYGEAGRKLFESIRKDAGGFTGLLFDHVSNSLLNHQLAV